VRTDLANLGADGQQIDVLDQSPDFGFVHIGAVPERGIA
jgi:hypothetical protein